MRNASHCRTRSGSKGQHGAGNGTGTICITIRFMSGSCLYTAYIFLLRRDAQTIQHKVKHTRFDKLCSVSKSVCNGALAHSTIPTMIMERYCDLVLYWSLPFICHKKGRHARAHQLRVETQRYVPVLRPITLLVWFATPPPHRTLTGTSTLTIL